MSERIPLPRTAKGKRPVVFDDPTVDHLVTMVLELSAQLTAVYQRLDTVERLLEDANLVRRDQIETYEPDAGAKAERSRWIELFLDRLFRTIRADRG